MTTIEQIWEWIRNQIPHLTLGHIAVVIAAFATIAKGVEDLTKKRGIGNKIYSGVKKFISAPFIILKKVDSLEKSIKESNQCGEANAKTLQEISLRMRVSDELDPHMKFMMDENGSYFNPNRAFLNHFGFSEADLKGRNWENQVDENDMTQVALKMHRAIKNRSDFVSDHRIISKDGERFKCHVVGIPLVDKDKILLGFMCQLEIIN